MRTQLDALMALLRRVMAHVGYHCHTERAGKPMRAAPPQARTAEERRLVRECKGRPNAGACAGYANR